MARKHFPVPPPALKAGFPKQFPMECGAVAPITTKTLKFRIRTPRGSKHHKYHSQQAK